MVQFNTYLYYTYCGKIGKMKWLFESIILHVWFLIENLVFDTFQNSIHHNFNCHTDFDVKWNWLELTGSVQHQIEGGLNFKAVYSIVSS